ncbi:MAG: OmpA family protein [Fibrobacterales bacterium]
MKYSIVIFAVTLIMFACSDNPEPVIEPIPESVSSSEAVISSSEDIQAQKLEKKRKNIEEMINKIMQEDVYFDFDKHMLSEKARDVLSRIADILIEAKEFTVTVEGHTDDLGTEAYNMSLGGKRAKAVFEFLTNYGVAETRLKTMSFGEEKPKSEGSTDKDRELNRRAHFKVSIEK